MSKNEKDLKVAVGVDIGGTNTKIGIVNSNGELLGSSKISTQVYGNFDDFLNGLCDNIDKLISKVHTKENIEGIGIGSPNGQYFSGEIVKMANVTWEGYPFKIEQKMKQYYSIPVKLINDARAATLGINYFGNSKKYKNFIVVTLGTGLGGGIVVNGRLVMGRANNAGEFGHVVINPNGRQCGCGRKGCLETYVSATGIKRTVYKLLSDYNGFSSLADISFQELTPNMITEAARNGDKVALDTFEYTANIFGRALANFSCMADPEAVILFGGLANANEILLNPLKKAFEENLMYVYKNEIKIEISELQEVNPAVLGAAALILHNKTFF